MDGDSATREQPNNRKRVIKDDVIAKLKDDGDFDNLRLKIIRKLKDNGLFEAQMRIVGFPVFEVEKGRIPKRHYLHCRQSAALNRDSGANMKPRQISDAIFDEVG
ncbi:unnamed protein product [Linum tenue]|nr:unnamed protein product [Linum tenue]